MKITKGNEVAWFCARVAEYCMKKGIWFSIENPTNYIIWELKDFQALLQREEVQKVEFHACMWGSKRNKRTAFVTNCEALRILQR